MQSDLVICSCPVVGSTGQPTGAIDAGCKVHGSESGFKTSTNPNPTGSRLVDQEPSRSANTQLNTQRVDFPESEQSNDTVMTSLLNREDDENKNDITTSRTRVTYTRSSPHTSDTFVNSDATEYVRKLENALYRIGTMHTDPRPDGSFNYSRAAIIEIAREALK